MSIAELVTEKFAEATDGDSKCHEGELVAAIRELYANADEQGLRRLFNEFKDWYVRIGFKEALAGDLTEEAYIVFDKYCCVADYYMSTNDMRDSLECAKDGPSPKVGPIRRYWRDKINYGIETRIN